MAKHCVLCLLFFHVAIAFLPSTRRIRRPDVLRTSPHAQSHDRMDIKLLLVDHYDSFTYNLADLLARYCTEPPDVMFADDPRVLSGINAYDGIVLSPGPGHPRDYPASVEIVRQFPRPILGVCMGHQVLALAHEGASSIVRAPSPIHGQIHSLNVTAPTNDPLWGSIDLDPPVATRYHSLAVDLTSSNPQSSLIATATTRNHPCVLMGLRHASLPHFGVQFHPESIRSEALGRQLVENFCRYVAATSTSSSHRRHQRHALKSPAALSCLLNKQEKVRTSPYTVYILKVPNLPLNGANFSPSQLFDTFLSGKNYSFWLDRESSECDGVSILGSGRRRVEYWRSGNGREIKVVDGQTIQVHKNKDILSYLEEHPPVRSIQMLSGDALESSTKLDASENELPFDFCGGHVGYLGYEVRHDTAPKVSNASTAADHPTAAFIWADRSFVFDHEKSEWYLVGVAEQGNTKEIMEWMKTNARHLQQGVVLGPSRSRRQSFSSLPTFRPNRSRATYSSNFAQCMDYIRRGDSYELCLTNQIETSAPNQLSPLHLFHILRRRNPAPHAAYFHWGSALAICCSSPERFLSLVQQNGQRIVESKPIKGTARRILDDPIADTAAADRLRTSIKDRAENHMIVDLLRNDVHRVCTSVAVPHLMAIESFATVHQMVSTIRGTLRPDCTAVDVLRACFPGGSMTGAPKVRSMEILDELEEQVPRGVYSGCLGYLSANGSMDMNIVIRSAVLTKDEQEPDQWKVRIGAGGAITALSDGEDEYDEMWLKASAVMNAIEEWAAAEPEYESRRKSTDADLSGRRALNVTAPVQ